MNQRKAFIFLVSIGLFMLTSCTAKEKENTTEKETSEKTYVSQDRQMDRADDNKLEDDVLFTLYERLYPVLRNGLVIINTETFGDDYYEGDWKSCQGISFTVKNNTPYDIPGEAYFILYKEGYWGGGKMGTEIIPGADIKRGETVTLKTKELASSVESETSQLLKIKELSYDDFKRLFHLSKAEAESIAKTLPKQVVGKEPLSICVEGMMGGCATRLCIDGKQGHMLYNSGGKDYELNQQRDVVLVNYDANTNQLVLRVENRGTPTGQLIGKLKNGVYTGKFKNVNGKTSPFSFE